MKMLLDPDSQTTKKRRSNKLVRHEKAWTQGQGSGTGLRTNGDERQVKEMSDQVRLETGTTAAPAFKISQEAFLNIK